MGSTQSTWGVGSWITRTTENEERLIDTTELTQTLRWARARMREVSPMTSSRCTRTASSLWTSTRMASSTKMTSVVLLTTLVSSRARENLTVSLARLEVPAPTTTWSRCSRRRWLEMETTLMTLLSRLSRPTTWGDKMTKAEIDDIFGEFEIDEDYMIKSKDVIGLFVAVKEEPKKEEEAPAPVEAPVEDEDEADAKKKKKKKKKAAK